MLSHDRWATRQMLDACRGLGDDEFHRRFEMGPGSVHDTLTHVVAAMRAWTETLGGMEARPRLDGDGRRRTVEALGALHEASCVEFAAEAHRCPLEERVTRRLRDGRTLEFSRGEVVTQVTSHGMHHRAQCLNMLRQLGVKPMPPSSVAEWTWMGAGRRIETLLALRSARPTRC